MTTNECNCVDPAAETTSGTVQPDPGWLDQRPVMHVPFPDQMAANMQRIFDEPVDSFAAMIAAMQTVTDGATIAVEELCHVDNESAHVAETAGDTYNFKCFYDGIALAYLVDEPVTVWTESPTGDLIEIAASPDGDIDVTPSGAVMSFGVTTDPTIPAEEEPTVDELYGAICPFVKAFETRADYERWASDVAATTVGLPVAAGMPVAAALTGSGTVDIPD